MITQCFSVLFFYSRVIYPASSSAKIRINMRVLKYGAIFWAFFVVVVLSGLLNDTNWFIILKSIIEYYFPYLFLFLSICGLQLSEKDQELLIKLCYFFILLQVPVVLMQYFWGGYSTADSISGTISDKDLGGTGANSVLSAFLFLLSMLRILIWGTPGYLALGLLAFVPSVFGGSRFGLILMFLSPLILFTSMIWIGDFNIKNVIVRLLFLMLILVVVIYFVFVYFLPKFSFMSI